jgi:hypothetical protein
MSSLAERAELLFRRQVALEGNAPKRDTVVRVDPVPPLHQASRAIVPAGQRSWDGLAPTKPQEPLLASSGHFNMSRIGPDAVAWAIVIGKQSLQSLEQMLLALCNVQSVSRNFRPVFILDVPEHIELMRRYGFTFEVLADPDFLGLSKDDQIALFMAKWNAQQRIDLGKGDSMAAMIVDGASQDPGPSAAASVPRDA